MWSTKLNRLYFLQYSKVAVTVVTYELQIATTDIQYFNLEVNTFLPNLCHSNSGQIACSNSKKEVFFQIGEKITSVQLSFR